VLCAGDEQRRRLWIVKVWMVKVWMVKMPRSTQQSLTAPPHEYSQVLLGDGAPGVLQHHRGWFLLVGRGFLGLGRALGVARFYLSLQLLRLLHPTQGGSSAAGTTTAP